jgi:hypothetical protein
MNHKNKKIVKFLIINYKHLFKKKIKLLSL